MKKRVKMVSEKIILIMIILSILLLGGSLLIANFPIEYSSRESQEIPEGNPRGNIGLVINPQSDIRAGENG